MMPKKLVPNVGPNRVIVIINPYTFMAHNSPVALNFFDAMMSSSLQVVYELGVKMYDVFGYQN